MTPVLRVPMVSLVGEITRQQLPTRTATFGLRQSLFRQRVPVYQERAPSSHTGELSSRESLERTTPSSPWQKCRDCPELTSKPFRIDRRFSPTGVLPQAARAAYSSAF